MALPEKSHGVSYSWLVDRAAEVQRRQDQNNASTAAEEKKKSGKEEVSEPPPVTAEEPAPAPASTSAKPKVHSNFVRLLEIEEERERQKAQEKDRAAAVQPVVEPMSPGPAVPAANEQLWIAEGAGGVFTTSRVRPISIAQDAMTHVEEAVYDALWGPRHKGEVEPYRTVKIGYAELAKRSRVSKRSIQSVVDRLIEKGMMRVESPSDTLRRIPTTYCVFSYAEIRKHQKEAGRQWVIRTGKGVFYAKKLPSTVEARSPSTVEARSPSTVEAASTILLGIKDRHGEATTSSTFPVVAVALHETLGRSDDDLVARIVSACRQIRPDAAEDEIAHFISVEVSRLKHNPNIRSISGLLIGQVAKCFEGESFRLFREAAQKSREAEAAETHRVENFIAEQRRILTDPHASEQDKRFAAMYLENQQ